MKNTLAIRRAIFSVIVYFLITLILSLVINMLRCDKQTYNIYLEFIMFPLSAFISGYAITMMTKRLLLALISCIIVSLFFLLQVVGLNPIVFGLIILYLINSCLGALLAISGSVSRKSKRKIA